MDILVLIMVIEVGVNVLNVIVMIIMDVDCFGFSQFYQFRGCVGWGDKQFYVVFVVNFKMDFGKDCMCIMIEIINGFVFVEEDLKMCGLGEIFGIRQLGFLEF